jgi:hypothetical protein
MQLTMCLLRVKLSATPWLIIYYISHISLEQKGDSKLSLPINVYIWKLTGVADTELKVSNVLPSGEF